MITQVSSSKKWQSKPAINEHGKSILQKNGKPVLRKSYSVLQDDFYHAMRSAGYTDIPRGERGSGEEHLTVTQFKVEREQECLTQLQAVTVQAQAKLNAVAPVLKNMDKLAEEFSEDPEQVLPEANVSKLSRRIPLHSGIEMQGDGFL